MYIKNLIQLFKIIVLGLILTLGISYTLAWTAPTQAPPNGNTSMPINVSSTSQTKTGPLWANGLFSNSGAYFAGNVGIGTGSPAYKLDVAGDIRAQNAFLRTTGSSGWYNDTYAGGWYMTDSNWVRSYGNKSVWVGGTSGLLGLLGSDNGLTVGYGGAMPPQKGAIISGNVGIGTTVVGAKLDVNGSVKISGNIDASGTIKAGGGTPIYNTQGPFSGCSAGVPSQAPSATNWGIQYGCTCLTDKLSLSSTCTYNSFMSGGNNSADCIFSCNLTTIGRMVNP